MNLDLYHHLTTCPAVRKLFVKLYKKVYSAINRCSTHLHYGGRGIQVHKPWLKDPTAFVVYLTTLEGWNNPSLMLDRIDNDGHYEPGNLRFTTYEESNYNRRPNSKRRHKIQKFCGEHKSSSWWKQIEVHTNPDIDLPMNALPEREAFVLESLFGLSSNPKTLQEIGVHLGISKERVRQIKNRALTRLRSALLTTGRDRTP